MNSLTTHYSYFYFEEITVRFITKRFNIQCTSRMIWIVVWLLVNHLSFAQDINIGLPFIHQYSTSEYKAGIQNWSIRQDKRGLIYVANNFGVLEYDGSNWIRYQVVNGTKVRDLALADNGLIYVANQGDFGFLKPNTIGAYEYVSLADSLDPKYRDFDETWKVFYTPEEVFFCSFDNLFIYRNNAFETINYTSAPEEFFYANHQLYILQLDQGLYHLQDSGLQLINGGEFFKSKPIASVISLAEGRLLITTVNNGLFIYDGYKITPWLETRDLFEPYNIYCAIRLRNGNYVFGTENNGLFITDAAGKLIIHLNKTNGLYDRKVLSLFQDNQNNLWVGHNNGLSYVELELPFTLINEAVGLPGTGYAGYLKDDVLYLGTGNGLFKKDLRNPQDSGYELIPGSAGQVYDIKEIEGNLLMGHHEGAFEIKSGEVQKLSSDLGSWTFLPLRSYPNYMLEGTYQGLNLYKKKNESWEFVTKVRGFAESSRVIEEGDDGDIWITHGYKGVFRLKLSDDLIQADEVKFYGEKDGLPSNILINVYRIRNELIFTTEGKIYKYDQYIDRFIEHPFYGEIEGIEESLSIVTEDAFDNLYFMGRNSLGALKKNSSGVYEASVAQFNKIKDMMNDDLQNMSILNGSFVLFGAKEGFILYDRNKSIDLSIPYQALIRNVTNADSTLFAGNFFWDGAISSKQPEEQLIELLYKQNSVKFGFSAPFMDGFEQNSYQYKLEGFDKGWSEWQPETEKEYTNLKEGRYTFYVKAKNYAEIQSEVTSFRFIILAPWYRSALAYVSYGVSGIIILFLAFRVLDKRHKEEKERIQTQSDVELNQKDDELRIVTAKSEAEIELLKNEKLKSEINHKNKELASSTMNLINKNEFISHVKSNLSSLISKSKSQEVRLELNKIIKNIDRNISQDNDWEHFEFHFDQVHGDFSNQLHQKHPDLSPQEMKISALLRMNLSTKEIAHLLNISVRGVEISRYRLRKRLRIDRKTNLTEYLMNF
ncbi:MAG: triple tyrosine motif-containing protein [Bacteroidota bacterium]